MNWRSPCPNEYLAVFVSCDALRVDQFGFQIIQRLVIKVELALQRLEVLLHRRPGVGEEPVAVPLDDDAAPREPGEERRRRPLRLAGALLVAAVAALGTLLPMAAQERGGGRRLMAVIGIGTFANGGWTAVP